MSGISYVLRLQKVGGDSFRSLQLPVNIQSIPDLSRLCATLNIRRSEALFRAPLPDGHELVFPYLGPGPLVVLNRSASRLLDSLASDAPVEVLPVLSDENPAAAWETILNLVLTGVLSSPLIPPPRPPETSDTLTAWLHITAACNLRCTYCYVVQSPKFITLATGRLAINRLVKTARQHGFRRLKIKFAGGEPTLQLERVLKLHEYAVQQATPAGLELDGVLLTNGTLLKPEDLQALKTAGLRVSISLDGFGPDHDAQRPYANGKGSADAVERTLELLTKSGLPVSVTLTLSNANLESLPATVEILLQRGIPFSLNFAREAAQAANPARRLDAGRLISALRTAYNVIAENLPPYSVLNSLLDRVRLAVPHRYSCGAGRDYLVVGPEGQVASCHMTLETPLTHIKYADPLSDLRQPTNGFQNLPVEMRSPCNSCRWRLWCSGGCPLMTFANTGQNDLASPYCAVYQALIPEVLHLEGLRVLRTAAAL